jgi:hypothetical protein
MMAVMRVAWRVALMVDPWVL